MPATPIQTMPVVLSSTMYSLLFGSPSILLDVPADIETGVPQLMHRFWFSIPSDATTYDDTIMATEKDIRAILFNNFLLVSFMIGYILPVIGPRLESIPTGPDPKLKYSAVHSSPTIDLNHERFSSFLV